MLEISANVFKTVHYEAVFERVTAFSSKTLVKGLLFQYNYSCQTKRMEGLIWRRTQKHFNGKMKIII